MEKPVGSSSPLRRRRRIRRKTKPSLPNESSLPDDIIVDILSRLPAKGVLRSRCVCRRWLNLTSTIDFIDLHRRRSFPMILMDCFQGRASLDRCWEPSQTRSKILKVYDPCEIRPVFSHNGLLVVIYWEAVIIYNPIYRDVLVNINLSHGSSISPFGRYGICVVFFHPVQKDYCTLWYITLTHEPLKVQYRILNLESNPQWRDIKNPCTQNARLRAIDPVLFDEYLFWMVEAVPNSQHLSVNCNSFNCDIMEYDIRNEEFRVIPCPVPLIKENKEYNVNLVDIDSVVSLVQVFPSTELVKINIWKLKNHAEQSWTSSHYIVSSDVCRGYGVPKAVAFWNGELVLHSLARLYVCNLKLGTFRTFGQKYSHDHKFFSHLTSLVSLRNCKSKICMLEEYENNQKGEIQALTSQLTVNTQVVESLVAT